MAEKKADAKKPQRKAEKKPEKKKGEKKAETVLLSPEELRRISGGQTSPSPIVPKRDDMRKP
jgi:hypothetical protein